MSDSKVKYRSTIYEIDDKDTKLVGGPELQVESHWNRDEFVVLNFNDKRCTVDANDLVRAIKNCTNWR